MEISEDKIYIPYEPETVKELLEDGRREFFDLKTFCDQFIEFPKNYLLLTSYPHGLYLYDQNFNFIKKITKINDEKIHSFDIESNKNKDILYIYNRVKHAIIMVNTDFQMIKYVGGINDFGFVKGLCYQNGFLYVSDYDRCCINVYSEKLDFLNSVQIGYRPLRLKANNSMVCVEVFREDEFSLVFYSLDSLKSKTKTTYLSKFSCGLDNQRLSEIDSQFYEIHNNISNKVFFFNEEKDTMKRIELVSNVKDLKTYSNFIRFDNNLLILMDTKILKISYN
jgi:hypothetical protein